MARLVLVPLATGLSDFEAKVLTARLGADGVIWEIRGVVDSVYPFGGVDVLVPRDELDDARACLAAAGGPVAAVDPDEPVTTAPTSRATGSWWFAVLACAATLTFMLMRLLAMG